MSLLKRTTALLFAVISAFALSFSSFAEEAAYHLNSLDPSRWSGAKIAKDDDHGVISVVSEDGGDMYSSAEFPVGSSRAAFVYFDAGGYNGERAGAVTVAFTDENGVTLSESEVGVICDGSFRRYSLGSEELYAEVPENSATVHIKLSADGQAYYRNFTLKLSDTAPRKTGETEWTVSDKLGLVEVRTTKAQYWILVCFIFLVALGMLGVRKALDKTQKNNINNKRRNVR